MMNLKKLRFWGIGFLLVFAAAGTACGSRDAVKSEQAQIGEEKVGQMQAEKRIQIKFIIEGKEAVAELADNATSRDFLQAMPMTLHFKDFNKTEKIADLPRPLSKENAPDGFMPKTGDLALYGPWGNISVFYKDFDYSQGLIPLGHFISGLDNFADRDGEFVVKVELIPGT